MPTTKYVNGTTGDDTNGGESSGDAYATVRRAVAVIASGADASNRNIIIIHSGTYSEGPIRGGTKDHIKMTTAGDGNVHVKFGNFHVNDSHRILECGDDWLLEGNGLDLVFFAHGGLGVEQYTSNFQIIAQCTNSGSGGGSNSTLETTGLPFTASSCVFVGNKYTYGGRSPNESQACQDGFGDAFHIQKGTVKNCALLHLSKIGGSRGAGNLSLNGNLLYMTGMTSSFNNGVYVPATTSDFCNNTLVQCSGGAQLTQFPAKNVLNNFFLNCTSYGANASSANNWFLDKDGTTTRGNLVRGMALTTVNAVTTTWESDTQPANQMSGTATNLVNLNAVSSFVGYNARQILTTANKGYSDGGAYSNVPDAFLFSCGDNIFPKNLEILPFGGKSVNHVTEKSSLVDVEGITGRSVSAVDLTKDLLLNTYSNRPSPPCGCFDGAYVEYAFEPQAGSEKIMEHQSLGRETAIVVKGNEENNKSNFRNVDATTFNKSPITPAGLRGRHTIYRVTTTKT